MSSTGDTLRALGGTLRDVVSRTGDPDWHALIKTALQVAPRASVEALPWLARAREGAEVSLMTVVRRHARRDPNGLAFEMGKERLGWRDVDAQVSRLSRVLAERGVGRGDVVALVGRNSPTYLVVVLAVASVGAVTALVNWHLEGTPLDHAILSSGARLVVAEEDFAAVIGGRDALAEAVQDVLVYGRAERTDDSLEALMDAASPLPIALTPVDATDDFVYIYTSGTTGLPKPCRVSHARALVAGAGFGSLMFRFQPGDKLYSVLPLYHSSALLIGASSAIMMRTPMAMRAGFSASAFWSDVQRYQATTMLYIGELCRYLINRPPEEAERYNPIHTAVGNGMRADVWETFSRRFDIPHIREFYSATEAPGAIFNITGKVGSVGHVPMRRLSRLKLARYDVDRDDLVRDEDGFCIECGPDEVGELVIRLEDRPASALSDFRGYTDEEATKKKVMDDVFEPGDRYFLSGDLLRFDDNDFFYFVDRIGDTYRWKGENVSTAEVGEIIGRAPGVLEATVSSVPVPGMEGRAGLAALVCEGPLDLEGFWETAQELPGYAQPRFLRVMSELDTTGTFKIQKTKLRADGVDPSQIDDPLFLRRDDGYVRLTPALWADVVARKVRL